MSVRWIKEELLNWKSSIESLGPWFSNDGLTIKLKIVSLVARRVGQVSPTQLKFILFILFEISSTIFFTESFRHNNILMRHLIHTWKFHSLSIFIPNPSRIYSKRYLFNLISIFLSSNFMKLRNCNLIFMIYTWW